MRLNISLIESDDKDSEKFTWQLLGFFMWESKISKSEQIFVIFTTVPFIQYFMHTYICSSKIIVFTECSVTKVYKCFR